MNTARCCLAAGLALCTLAATAQTPTSTSAAGPYYATPSWDQKLPSATRFIVLTNWGGEAVLDRETGLVWALEREVGDLNYEAASHACLQKSLGGRGGWRLPTMQELTRTAGIGPATIADSPFAFLNGTLYFGLWSTTADPRPNQTAGRWVLRAKPYLPFTAYRSDDVNLGSAWCVQSAAPAAAAQ